MTSAVWDVFTTFFFNKQMNNLIVIETKNSRLNVVQYCLSDVTKAFFIVHTLPKFVVCLSFYAYNQGCHNVLISKICPFFEGLCLRSHSVHNDVSIGAC